MVEAGRWVVLYPGFNKARARRPDLLVAFGVDPAAYGASNGYVVTEQGKPPDFVPEVASASTEEIDVGAKRRDYAALGIPECWRFDETGGAPRGETGWLRFNQRRIRSHYPPDSATPETGRGQRESQVRLCGAQGGVPDETGRDRVIHHRTGIRRFSAEAGLSRNLAI